MATPARKLDKKATAKRLALDIEARERRRLRERLRHLTEAKKRVHKRISKWAKAKRTAITERYRKEREECRRRISEAAKAERALVTERRRLLTKNADSKLGAVRAARKKQLDEEIKSQRLIRDRGKARLALVTAKEKRQESDDAVRRNLPKDLIPIFDGMARSIKGSARRTRTESFLHWVEEHPSEVIEQQAANADRDVAAMIREHHESERRKYKRDAHSKGPLVAVWRGRTYALATRARKSDPKYDFYTLRTWLPDQRATTWELKRRKADHGWLVNRVTSGKPSRTEHNEIDQWVSTIDEWTPLDDLKDVPF